MKDGKGAPLTGSEYKVLNEIVSPKTANQLRFIVGRAGAVAAGLFKRGLATRYQDKKLPDMPYRYLISDKGRTLLELLK